MTYSTPVMSNWELSGEEPAYLFHVTALDSQVTPRDHDLTAWEKKLESSRQTVREMSRLSLIKWALSADIPQKRQQELIDNRERVRWTPVYVVLR